MKKMTRLFGVFAIASLLFVSACGSGQSTTKTTNANSTDTTAKSNTNESKSTSSTTTSATTSSGQASSTVKGIYDHAMKRDCSAIPPMLTEDFRKAVGTSKDELDALCDSFTDSGKLSGFEIKGEELNGDAGTVKVMMTFKDGKKEEKTEKVKKTDGKWLMDS